VVIIVLDGRFSRGVRLLVLVPLSRLWMVCCNGIVEFLVLSSN
jgi:hypothetical protein